MVWRAAVLISNFIHCRNYRRAHENRGLLKKLQMEKMMHRKELTRRIAKGQLFYTPQGDYTPVGWEHATQNQK